ncbi:MAG: hypothetical protein KDK30_02930 [Leptospiraceae bacterium]|nr:hypothetical protein [Leptospiraceae bacterium]
MPETKPGYHDLDYRNIDNSTPESPDEVEVILDAPENYADQNGPFKCNVTFKNKSGESVSFELISVTVRQQNGDVSGYDLIRSAGGLPVEPGGTIETIEDFHYWFESARPEGVNKLPPGQYQFFISYRTKFGIVYSNIETVRIL